MASARSLPRISRIDEIPVGRASDLAAASIPAPEELAALLPAGVPLGVLVTIKGVRGVGASTLCYRMLAAGAAAGLYAALLDPLGRCSPAAIAEAGVPIDRFVIIRPPSARRVGGWAAKSLGALIDGFSISGVLDPQVIGERAWSRVAARVREREAVVVAAGPEAPSRVAGIRISLSDPRWRLDVAGRLESRTVAATVEGMAAPRRDQVSLASPPHRAAG